MYIPYIYLKRGMSWASRKKERVYRQSWQCAECEIHKKVIKVIASNIMYKWYFYVEFLLSFTYFCHRDRVLRQIRRLFHCRTSTPFALHQAQTFSTIFHLVFHVNYVYQPVYMIEEAELGEMEEYKVYQLREYYQFYKKHKFRR